MIATVDTDALLIALEPECAGIYCRTLPVNMFAVSTEPPTFVSGTKYVIVDAGGKLLDISVVRICVETYGRLSDVLPPSTNGEGGSCFDDRKL